MLGTCPAALAADAATGGSAIQAIHVLLDHGVQPNKIFFLNMIASPEGLRTGWEAHTEVRGISAWVDARLSDDQYSAYPRCASATHTVIPGLGDYGDRYYSG
mgnify:FL=1